MARTKTQPKEAPTAEKREYKKLDFASLANSVEDVEKLPSRATADNPFIDVLSTSYENDQAKAVTVPADQAKTVTSKLRTAAANLGIGVRIVPTESEDGTVRIAFQGTERRAYTRKESDED